MPFVRIEMLAGKPPQFRQAVLEQVHAALVDAFRIPDDDRNQTIVEFDAEHFESPAGRRPDPIWIHITCFAGRSLEAKRLLYRRLAERLAEDPGIEARNICVVLNDVPRENWGFAGRGADQIDLGFKVDV